LNFLDRHFSSVDLSWVVATISLIQQEVQVTLNQKLTRERKTKNRSTDRRERKERKKFENISLSLSLLL